MKQTAVFAWHAGKKIHFIFVKIQKYNLSVVNVLEAMKWPLWSRNPCCSDLFKWWSLVWPLVGIAWIEITVVQTTIIVFINTPDHWDIGFHLGPFQCSCPFCLISGFISRRGNGKILMEVKLHTGSLSRVGKGRNQLPWTSQTGLGILGLVKGGWEELANFES